MDVMRSKRSPSSNDEPPVMRVVQQIEDLIAAGSIVPGQRLVEHDLVVELGTPRRAVREALRFLAGAGVVELFPNRGARIVRAEPSRLGDIMEVYVALLRAAMERFAAQPISPEAIKSLDAAARGVQSAISSDQRIVMLFSMEVYCRTMMSHCGNGYLLEAFSRINSNLHTREWANRIELEEVKKTCLDYGIIHQHLMKGDAQSAYAMLLPHVQNSLAHIRGS